MGTVRRPEVGDYVLTLGYGPTVKKIVEVKSKTAYADAPGRRMGRDRILLYDVVACSADKAAIDRLAERLKSAQAERDRRRREADVAYDQKRRAWLDGFNEGAT